MKSSTPAAPKGVVLSVSAIIDGSFYRFGEPLPYTRETLPERLRRYIAEPVKEVAADGYWITAGRRH